MSRRGGPSRNQGEQADVPTDVDEDESPEDYGSGDEPTERQQTGVWQEPRPTGVIRTPGPRGTVWAEGTPAPEADEPASAARWARQRYPDSPWYPPSGPPVYPPEANWDGQQPEPPGSARGGPRYDNGTAYSGYPGGRAVGWRNGRPTQAAGPDWSQYGPQYASQSPGRRRAGYGEPPPPQQRPQLPAWMLLLFAGLVAAVVAIIVVLLFGDTAAKGASASGPAAGAALGPLAPAVTLAGARQVLAGYTWANNQANHTRSDKDLAKAETGSSYALDAGQFRWLASTDPSNKSYTPLALKDPAFYIPLLPRTAYPRWFVTYAAYTAVNGQNRGAHGSGYIVFTQQGPGQAWLDALEPYVIPGAGPAPKVALDASGFATAVTTQATGLAAQPAALPAMTAAALSDAGKGIAVPGTLTDQSDAAFWRRTLPAGSSVSERHSPPAGAVYALRTADGGALVLFAGTATLRLAPPSGVTFQVVVPGYYDGKDALQSARLGYAEQFAIADPPRGRGSPGAVADVSGLDERL